MTLDELRYPIGKHDVHAPLSAGDLDLARRSIAELPDQLGAAVAGLDRAKLDTPYREGGWTVRQVVHHLADSHLNAYTRLRLALTEESPVIKPYDEERWAELPDAKTLDVEPSILVLRGLHHRWSRLLEALTAVEFERNLVHPEAGKFSVAQLTGLYGWHSRHHVAHITSLRTRSGW